MKDWFYFFINRMGEFRGTSNEDDAECGKDCSTDSYMDNSSNTNDDDYAECSLGDHNKSQPHNPSSSHNVFHSVEEDNVALDEYWNIVQMNFQTEDECYNFYNSYARRKGFSVRKDIVRREKRVGAIQYRRFVCSKEGIRNTSLVNLEDRVRRERALTRMESPASLSIKLDKKHNILSVLKHLEVKEIPKCCVLQRLSKNAKGGLPSVRKSDLHVWTEKQKNYYEVSARGSELFDLASNSPELFGEVKEYMESQLSKRNSSNAATKKHTHVDEVGQTSHGPEGSVLDPICVATKGAPRRMKGWDEHRPRLCSRCRQPGHDIRRCSDAKREEMSAAAVSAGRPGAWDVSRRYRGRPARQRRYHHSHRRVTARFRLVVLGSRAIVQRFRPAFQTRDPFTIGGGGGGKEGPVASGLGKKRRVAMPSDVP